MVVLRLPYCFIGVLLAVVNALLVAAQTPSAADSARFLHLGVSDGLSQSSVYCIAQDAKGFMWFGTADGLNRYDGYSFVSFRSRPDDSTTLIHKTIRSLYVDRQGVLWIGTDRGLNRYESRTGTFSRFVPPPAEDRWVPQFSVHAMCEDHQGRFWVGTPGGLFLFDRDRWRADTIASLRYGSDSSTNVICILEDLSHRLWVGLGRGLEILEVRSGSVVTTALPGSLRPLERATVSCLYQDSRGMIWLCAGEAGLFRFDPSNGTAKRIRSVPGLPSAVAEDESGTIWAGTQEGWLTIPEQKQFLLAQGIESPARSFSIRQIYKDRSGVLWVCTDGDGVFKRDRERKQFLHFKHDPRNPNSLSADFVRAVLEDAGGNLWVGTQGGGLSCLEKSKGVWKRFAHIRGDNTSLPSNNVFALHQTETGALWIGTDEGLAHMDLRTGHVTTLRIRSSGRSANVVQSIVTLARDTLGVGTMSRPWKFACGSGEFFPIIVPTGDTLAGNTWVLSPGPHGGLWWGTYGGGVGYLQSAARIWQFFKPGSGKLTDGSVRSIHEDSAGVVWFGTEDGLVRFDRRSGSWKTYGVDDGLANSFVYAILPADDGNLWLSTNMGLSRLNPRTGFFRNYRPADGIQSDEFNTGASFRSQSGELFFGGINGLNAFFPDSIRDNPHAPQVVLSGIKVFDVPFEPDTSPSEIRTLELTYDQKILSFEFAGLEYTNPARNSYAYMMEGFEKEWTYCGIRREVRYTNLPPGHYTFRVRAANSDGVWGDEGLAVVVTIVPPFWRTWWFVSFAALLILGTVGGSIRFVEMRKLKRRIDRLEKEHALDRERERISKDMHDDVGANLTKIAIMSELALTSTRDPGVVKQLERISGTARDVVDNISQIVWALNPKNSRLDDLIGYIREYALEFFEGTPIRCVCMFPDESPEVSLSSELRRNLFLIVKEALHNVAKHSGASEVTVALSRAGGMLTVRVTDNGRGFEIAGTSQFGNGLMNMKKRADEIHGTFGVDSEPGKGTGVELVVRLRRE